MALGGGRRGLTMLVLMAIVMSGTWVDARQGAVAQSNPAGETELATEFPDGIALASLVEGVVNSAPGVPAVLRLDRTTLGAGWESGDLLATGPLLIFVESGELTIVDELGIEGTYPADTRLLVPMGAAYSLRNDSGNQTTYLSLAFLPAGEEPAPFAMPITGDAPSGTPQATPVTGQATTVPLLQTEIAAEPAVPAHLFLVQSTWEPGATLPEHVFNGPVGFVGMNGELTVAGPSGIEGQIGAGDGVMFPAGLPNRARNASAEPVTVLMAGMVGVDQPLIAGLAEPSAPESTAAPESPPPTVVPIPTLEPTATPTPAPTMTPEPVVYQADDSNGGFTAWGILSGWSLLDGQLVSDGSNCTQLVAPIDLTGIRDYAIETEIQLIAPDADESGGFGLFSRWDGTQRYWAGYARWRVVAGVSRRFFIGLSDASNISDALVFRNDALALTDALVDDDWHSYRLEVSGNQSRLYVDGAEVVRAVDNRLLTGGDAGIWCVGAFQIAVRSFKVVPLGDSASDTTASLDAPPEEPPASGDSPLIQPIISSEGQPGVDVGSFLPSTADVPSYLVLANTRSRTLDEVAQNYTDAVTTTNLFTGWGWEANATCSFTMPDGVSSDDDQINGVYTSVHAFASASDARAALDFSLSEQMAGTALTEVNAPPLGDYARAIYGVMDYGNEITLLVQQESYLVRLSASALGIDPTSFATGLTQTLLLTRQS